MLEIRNLDNHDAARPITNNNFWIRHLKTNVFPRNSSSICICSSFRLFIHVFHSFFLFFISLSRSLSLSLKATTRHVLTPSLEPHVCMERPPARKRRRFFLTRDFWFPKFFSYFIFLGAKKTCFPFPATIFPPFSFQLYNIRVTYFSSQWIRNKIKNSGVVYF